MNNIITINKLSHKYNQIKALTNINLKLLKGLNIAIIGPDGVGKSTLLSLIAGVKKKQSGSININGLDISQTKNHKLLCKNISFMAQGLGKNLYLSLSVLENIDFIANLFNIPTEEKNKRINQLLKATSLFDFKDRLAGNLSGGMKQKLSLCCALIHNPNLLLLDEPTTGVDPLSRRIFWELINKIKKQSENMTIVAATAYTEEAEQFEYLICMNDGKIIAQDYTKNILTKTNSKNIEEAYKKMLYSHKKININNFVDIKTKYEYQEKIPPIIKANNLTKNFGNFTAVNDVSFEIKPGEIFGFLGSNGCGKSTTMKMLTGLLTPTSGTAKILGNSIGNDNLEFKKNIGYMSQTFSLYEEISVIKNLELHAKLYSIPNEQIKNIINNAIKDFNLEKVINIKPKDLSIGMRQRLQLAASCLHKPKILILDEPTSGVDPQARDLFWRHLIKLSRKDKITIFVSTHFMNEAERCDKISFMNNGKVLAIGTPEDLVKKYHTNNLEEAFIKYLEKDSNKDNLNNDFNITYKVTNNEEKQIKNTFLRNTITFAKRESKELTRDKLRLIFAILGPILLMIVTAYCISFDVGNIKFSVLDYDKTKQSNNFINNYSSSVVFKRQKNINNFNDIYNELYKSKTNFVIVIPNEFGRNLIAQNIPTITYYIDSSEPFNGNTINQYITMIHLKIFYQYLKTLNIPQLNSMPDSFIEPKFVYNQEFKSRFVFLPGIIMVSLILISTILTALSIVREKETGSILNLYSSPANIIEYFLGKQIPYIVLSLICGIILILITTFIFQIPIKGSIFALMIGILLYVSATSALGLLISCFTKNQIVALMIGAIISLIPTINFCGLIYPVSTLQGMAYWTGFLFPASWFQLINIGVFLKGLNFYHFIPMYIMLIAFNVTFLGTALIITPKQEK